MESKKYASQTIGIIILIYMIKSLFLGLSFIGQTFHSLYLLASLVPYIFLGYGMNIEKRAYDKLLNPEKGLKMQVRGLIGISLFIILELVFYVLWRQLNIIVVIDVVLIYLVFIGHKELSGKLKTTYQP